MNLPDLLASFASAFNQDQRLLSLQLGDGKRWGEALLPLSLSGDEALAGDYRFRVECLSASDSIELKALLGLPVRLGIAGADGSESLRCGVVSAAEALGSDGGFARYALTIEPPFALLRLRRTSRVFQDLSVDAIVRQIFAEHAAANPVFAAVQGLEFALAGALPNRSYCLQYRESDHDFICRLLREEGLSWRYEHLDGDTPQVRLLAFDDPYALPAANLERVRFHRSDATEEEDGLTRWDGARQVVPGSVALASFDYQPVATGHSGDESALDQGLDGSRLQSSLQHYDAPGAYYASDAEQLSHYARLRQQAHDAQAKRFTGGGAVRGLTAGQWFRLDDHPAHDGDSAEQREFVVTRQTLNVRNNLPAELARSLPTALRPTLAAGSDGDDAPFRTAFDAQRRGLPLTPAYAATSHAKPTARGAQTATVVGPANEEVHTDAHGRIKVQFHWQRPDEHPDSGANLDERSSCWLRVAMPSAGAGWGHQFIPRIGQEVLVDFIEGDIDRPVITGVLYNGSHPPPAFSGAGKLPGNRTLSGIKSKEHHGGQYNELLFDDTPGEVRAKLSSEYGHTQLNQGYLAHPRQDGKATPRGDGFELRTDLSGALRAAQGLLLSAHARQGARGNQLDREELLGQLQMALSIAQELAKQAETHEAESTDTQPQQQLLEHIQQWENGGNTATQAKSGHKAIMALGAPEGIALASEANIAVAAGSNHDLVAAKDSNVSVGQMLRMRVGQSLSIFVQQLGMKLIAAAGPIRIQAQSDGVEIGAAKLLHLYSLEKIVMEAPEVEIRGKNGSAIYSNGIVTKTTASHTQHAGNHVMDGPASVSAQLPGMPQSSLTTNEQFGVAGRSGKAQPTLPHEVLNGQGKLEGSGSTDSSGATATLSGKLMDQLKMTLKRN
ncbi:type VI secretion system Vgr family protein [Pseudogulbenkiania ferrooxidans]|uniref:Type VI secretion system Vgr family protein n=1 Tax=Pseudogulbenkiania ferrooxidans 2002 TaxID=279714 RepID=B9Z262_9NEIS|nr:type VI secretion system Vgr family protein [Pseudogulbenkiania ferrooxidans]EEG09507.1 type VI secretion system Vgr family protein [Pseudogulbenkiania ferrooxidans 2002]